MGIKDAVKKAAGKAADGVSKLSALSLEQLDQIQRQRDEYLSQMPNPNDSTAEELTKRLLAASSVEIYKAYLAQMKELYVPINRQVEYGTDFDTDRNIRFFNITKWVVDKSENSLEKLVNVYEVLSNESCNIALVFHRTCEKTNVYLAVTNTKNANNNVASENYKIRLGDAIRGNFPGSEWAKETGVGLLPCMQNDIPYSVAIASNVPAEKSEKFISQTIEKLLDGIVPDKRRKEYIVILLATPIRDIEYRKLSLAEMYSGLAPYASWTTTFTYNEQNATGSSATVGVNIGTSAGVQNGVNQANTTTSGITDSSSDTVTESTGRSKMDSTGSSVSDTAAVTNSSSNTHTEGINDSYSKTSGSSDTVGASYYVDVGHTFQEGATETVGESTTDAVTKGITESTSKSITETAGKAVTSTVGKSVAKTLGQAVSNSTSRTAGAFKSVNFGANFGANFARSSNVTATLGKSEGINQTFINYNIKHALEILEAQMKRLELSTALGMWDFAAYVMSEDLNVANNVAHSYLALTQGEESYMSQSAINLWRGDMGKASGDAKEICGYLRELRHPLFGLNPEIASKNPEYNVYPAIVTATTNLSGKELAYSLNFPKKSITGLPVIECAEFGRNVVSYDPIPEPQKQIELGRVFHMNHAENAKVHLALESLASHTLITGSTGSGKSNTIYQLLKKAMEQNVHFMVVEPAKGEYKHVFGSNPGVNVFGTNPALAQMLRINPFSFPQGIHVLEHLDRLVEIFNVCWPMYAAMPAILKSAVEKSYVDCGWDLVRSTNQYGKDAYPSFVDVARNIKEIIDSSEYDTDNKGTYKGSLLMRLQSLTNGINGMIFTNDEIAETDLFDKNVIIDLSRVGSSETKALIMGMLVLKLQEYRLATAIGMNENLKHITVLEEAHTLLRRSSIALDSESANLLGKSVEMLANAIAEMRTYGEGFVIADQAPGLLDLSVIRNTNTKIIMRLPDRTDRELVGRAANLNDDQITELAKLPCGVAAIYQNEWVHPVLCRVEKYTGQQVRYTYTPAEHEKYLDVEADVTSATLLDCIMNKEVLRKGKRSSIRRLENMIIHSKLDTTVKKVFTKYLTCEDDEAIEVLQQLMYDFLSVKEACEKVKDSKEITEWVHSMVDALNPSIKKYSKEQIDLALMLILSEQAIRNEEYNDIFIRFIEVYQEKGGVF